MIEGTGYTLVAPEGWSVPPDAPPAADVYLIDDEVDAPNFINTLNVLLGAVTGETSSEIEESGVAYLEGVVGATQVQVRPRFMIDGSESVHFSAQLSGDATYWTEQYIVADAGTAYTITFSLDEAMAQEDREALAESVLATWTWAPTSTAGYFEDPDAGFAVTFPGRPSVSESGGLVATFTTGPDAVRYVARGTAAAEAEIVPDTLASLFAQVVDQGAVLTGPEETFELEGMPALMNSFTDPNGKPATMVVAGEGHRLYQLIVIDGTPQERQAFFHTFTLLD